MIKLAAVDTETTGLDPDRHEIWEVGLILRDGDKQTEHHWFLPVDLGTADAEALAIGRYYERHPMAQGNWASSAVAAPSAFAREFSRLTAGAYLIGAVVSFDEQRLAKLLRANGACPGWNHHIIDVRALAAGAVGAHPPWHHDSIAAKLGVPPVPPAERHTALGDARMALNIYDAAMD
jgi:DNA polymerase III epsilon subunit-like protein